MKVKVETNAAKNANVEGTKSLLWLALALVGVSRAMRYAFLSGKSDGISELAEQINDMEEE